MHAASPVMPPHDANYYLSWEAMSEGRGNDAPLVICAACSGLIGRPARRSPVVNNVLSYSSFLLPPAAPRCCCVVAMFISRVKEARETEVGETKRRLQRKKGIFLMSCLSLSLCLAVLAVITPLLRTKLACALLHCRRRRRLFCPLSSLDRAPSSFLPLHVG